MLKFSRNNIENRGGRGSCLTFEMCDFMRCGVRKRVFQVKCFNIFATGCLSAMTMCSNPVLLSIGLVVVAVMSI